MQGTNGSREPFMKRIFALLLGIAALGCSDDDGGSGPNPDLDLVIGTWNLTELAISPAQDIDEDGVPTTNVVAELPCLSAQISIRADNTWSYSGVDVVVTTITGGLFKFFCSEQPRTAGGNWDLQGNIVRLADGTGNLTLFTLDRSALTLTNIIGQDLPGLQAEVYTRQ